MPIFSIVLDTFQITQTRSAHTDTDYVSVTLQIGGGTATQSVCKPMGNLNNGTFNPGVGFAAVNVPEGAPVVINYLILNSSLKDSVVEAGLEQLGGRVATTSVVPLTPLVSCLEAVATRFAQGDRPDYQAPFLRRSGCSRTEFPYLRTIGKLYQPTVLFADDAAYWHQGSGQLQLEALGLCCDLDHQGAVSVRYSTRCHPKGSGLGRDAGYRVIYSRAKLTLRAG
jgi:hypothetical protein